MSEKIDIFSAVIMNVMIFVAISFIVGSASLGSIVNVQESDILTLYNGAIGTQWGSFGEEMNFSNTLPSNYTRSSTDSIIYDGFESATAIGGITGLFLSFLSLAFSTVAGPTMAA